MMDSIERRLIGFVADGLRRSIVSIELFHCTDGGDSLIQEYPIDATKDDASHIAGEILNEASAHVECFSMPQRFAVQSYTRGRNQCGMRQFLLRPSNNARGAIGGLTEPPNERGIISQLMRHSEAAYAASIELTRSMATMHQARAETAETAFHRYLAEKERWSTYDADNEQRVHERRMKEDQAAHDHELIKSGLEEIQPVLRELAPHMARKLGRLADPGAKRPRASSPAPRDREATGEPAGNTWTTTDAAQGAAPVTSEPLSSPADDPRAARRAHLETVLNEITDDDAQKLEEILGPQAATRLVRAMVGVMNERR